MGMTVALGAAFLFAGGFVFARLLFARDLQILLDGVLPSYVASSNATKLLNTIKQYLTGVETQLQEAAERYRMLTQNIAAAVIIRDTSGRVTYCNPYTEVLTGYPVQEIYKTPEDFFLTVCHESEKERLIRSLKVTELAGEPFQCTFQYYHKSGIPMWAEARSVPIVDSEENVIGSLSIMLDVTASIRYQHQIEEKNKELKELTYMVSHDLKAPIFTVKGMIDAIQDDYQANLPSGLGDYLHHIKEATNRLENLVQSVLTYSKISSTETKQISVSLSDIIKEVITDYQPTLQKSQAQITMIGEMPIVLGDKTQLYQIFSNLIGNALKYRDPKRVPTISVKSEFDSTRRSAMIFVEDNGQGIPQDKLETIFRPFVRLHGQDIDGTGIGLACVKKLVERSGGSVTAKSVPGEGSTFSVNLRLAQ